MSELSINTNPSSFVALETLEDTNTALGHTENTISTGERVATAGDNPAAFGIAQEIGGEVAGQNAVNDGLAYAASVIDTTTSAANQIIGILKDVRNSVTAAGDLVGQEDALRDTEHQIDGYLREINTIARSSTTNGVNLLVGSLSSGFDITSNSLSYVTSLEGNTQKIDNVFDMIGRSGIQQEDVSMVRGYFSHFHLNEDEPDPNDSGKHMLGDRKDEKTLTDALGLTFEYTAKQPTEAVEGKDYAFMVYKPQPGYISGRPTPGEMFSDQRLLNQTIDVVGNSIKAMQYVTAKLGVNRQQIQKLASFGTRLDDNLQDARSSLVDADMAKESARLNSYRTKQQLSIKSLTIANGQSRNVLSLFRR